MTELAKELVKRFGEKNVIEVPVTEGEIPLLRIHINLKSPVTVLMTNGLSDYTMPVHEKEIGKEHNELFFCLPSYWQLDDLDDPNMNWVFYWIQRLAKYVKDKNTWFGHGHTMPCGNPFKALSLNMKANHFFLSNPFLLENELQPFKFNDKDIRFLAIIPMFEDEMDYKQGKGTLKLLKKFRNHGITEKLDDFRGTVLRTKWRFSKK